MAVGIEITFQSSGALGGSPLWRPLEQATEALDCDVRVLSVHMLVLGPAEPHGFPELLRADSTVSIGCAVFSWGTFPPPRRLHRDGRPVPGGQGMIDLALVTGGPDLEEVRALFREYADGLGVDLCFQGFDAELAGLPGDYAPPSGTLVLARIDRAVAGCVAAHRWDADACEMKRLYVRDAFRGTGCGGALVHHVLDWARSRGDRRIVLDTLPSMAAAQRMYERLGFRETEPYRPNPVPGARYLALDLA